MQGNVLITQGTRPFAQRIARSLSEIYTLSFGSADDIPSVLLQMGNYLNIPSASSPAFVHEMLKRCLDREIGSLIPLGADELQPMAAARPLFSEYGIDIWVPDSATLRGLSRVYNPPKHLALTVLHAGKPVIGQGGGGLHEGLSGVFSSTDPGSEQPWALCCIAD